MRGFDTDPTKPLTGGIQTTGSYPGRARTPQELMADIEEVLKLCPGTKKLNLHASYAIFTDGGWVILSKTLSSNATVYLLIHCGFSMSKADIA